jgi:hypothetical protein
MLLELKKGYIHLFPKFKSQIVKKRKAYKNMVSCKWRALIMNEANLFVNLTNETEKS